MKRNPAPLAFPLAGAAATALALWQSLPSSTPLRGEDGLWLAALELPFAFAFHMIWSAQRVGNGPRLIVGGVFSVLLCLPAIICFASNVDGEAAQFVLLLAPVYQWVVVALMTLLGIGLDALRSTKTKRV